MTMDMELSRLLGFCVSAVWPSAYMRSVKAEAQSVWTLDGSVAVVSRAQTLAMQFVLWLGEFCTSPSPALFLFLY